MILIWGGLGKKNPSPRWDGMGFFLSLFKWRLKVPIFQETSLKLDVQTINVIAKQQKQQNN